MTTANVQIKKILVGRGNATISSNYAGVRGEVTMNTTTKALHVHDGVTTGGWPLATEFYVANLIATAGGVPGPQGPQGNIGAQGVQGNVGPQGLQGIQGNVGPQGIQGNVGAQGPQGIQGNVGPQGNVGIQGIQGNVGATGAKGDQGLQGIQGNVGPQGIQGNVGATGAKGDQGSQGIQGNVGPQGIQGNVGATGSQGPQGTTGAKGDQGTQGIQGNTGAQGVSVTLRGNVANPAALPTPGTAGDGYIVDSTGNLWFWNSTISSWADIGKIVGPEGPRGPQGIQGNTGPQGIQGIQGNVGATGSQGIQGNIGPQGPQGIQGIQGNIGPQGSQGIQGNIGPKGDQGIQGIQGNIGPQGPQGTQGNIGPKGDQGSQGIQGNVGPQGIQGNVGAQGPQGIQGNIGPQGIQGNIGPKGDQGEPGSAANTGDFVFTYSNVSSSANANIRLTTNGNTFVLGRTGNLFLPNNMIFTTSPAISGTGIVFGDRSYQYTAWTGIAPDATRLSNIDGNLYIQIENVTGNIQAPGNVSIGGSRLGLANDSGFAQSNAAIIQSAASTLDTALTNWTYQLGFSIDPSGAPNRRVLYNTPIGDGVYFADIDLGDGSAAEVWLTWLNDAWAVQNSGNPPLWIQPAISVSLKNEIRTFITAVNTAYNALVAAEKSLDLFAGNATYTFGSDGNLIIPGNINFANGVNILSTVTSGSGTQDRVAIRNSGVRLDGSGVAWGGGVSGASNVAGFIGNSTTLFTFSGNGGAVMSAQLDGSLFVGDVWSGGAAEDVTADYAGWIVAASGIKSKYNVYAGNDLGASSNVTLGGNIVFTDGTSIKGSGGILTVPNGLQSKPGQYLFVGSDTSTEMSWSNSVQAPNTGVYSGIGSDGSGTSISVASTDSQGSWVSKVWQFDMDGNLTIPGNINYANGVNILSTVTSGGADLGDISFYDTTMTSTANLTVESGGNVFINPLDGDYSWRFGTNGNLTIPGNINFANGRNILSGITSGGSTYSNANVASYMLHFDGDIDFTSSTATIANVDTVTVLDHIRSPAYQFANGVNILSKATIVGNVGGDADNGTLWFNTEDGRNYIRYSGAWVDANPTIAPLASYYLGNLTVDGVKIIGADIGNSNGEIELVPDNTGTYYQDGQYIRIYPTRGQDAPHIHLTAGDNGDLILGDDERGVDINHDSNVYIRTDQYGTARNWRFGTEGNLTLPTGGNINYANGRSILSGITAGGGASTGNVTFSGSDITGTGTTVVLTANTTDWTFYSNANLVLPANATIAYSNGVSILSGLGGGGAADLGNIITPIADSDITSSRTANFVNLGADDGYSMRLGTYGENTVQLITDFSGNNHVWAFGANGNLSLPLGSMIGETETTTVITPPGAAAGQSLVIRPTAGQFSITTDHTDGFVPGESITVTVTAVSGADTGTLDYTFTDATAEQLGRATTGTLTFNEESVKSVSWTVPAQSDMTTFTFTITGGSGFVNQGGINPGNYITITLDSVGVEGGHVHLLSGNPATVDLYLGDDDQYVKIEKNGGDVVIGTDTNTNHWRFGADGKLTLPNGGKLSDTYYDGAINLTSSGNLYAGLASYDTQSWAGVVDENFTNPGIPAGGGFFVQTNVNALNGAPTNFWAFLGNGATSFPDNRPVTITGNLTVGNLVVNGNSTIINTESYTVVDNIIQMATDNPADTLDLGFVGHRTVNSTLQHTGLVRDASAGVWKLFSNVAAQPGTTVDFTGAVYDDLQLDKLFADTVHLTGAAPGTAYGAAGDQEGDIHVDDNYLYYCTSDWVSNSYTVGWEGAVGNTLFLTKGDYPTPQVGWTVTKGEFGPYTIQTVTDESNWRITFDGALGSPGGGTAILTNPTQPVIWKSVPLIAFQTAANATTRLTNGASQVVLQANGVTTFGNTATISNNGEFRIWADNDITVYRNGQDGYGVKSGSVEIFTNNGQRTVINSAGLEIKTGNLTIPNDKAVVFANGVNILSTVGSYANADAAAYLAGNSALYLGNPVARYTLQANNTQTFIGNVTTLTSGGAQTLGTTYLLNNIYFGANGAGYYRNTQTGAAQISMSGSGGFIFSGASGAVTANGVQGMGTWATISSTGLTTSNSLGITSAGALTAASGLVLNTTASITTNQTTASIFNATATTINLGGAATNINLGSSSVLVSGSNVYVGNAVGTSTGNLTVRARGTYNLLTLYGIAGGYNSPPYTAQSLTGGSGTGMTATYSATGGYVTTVTINNIGSGYRNGDILTLPGGGGSTVILSNYDASKTGIGQADYMFGIDGNLALPGNLTVANNLTINGSVTQKSAYYETVSNVTNTGGNLTCNFANSATFYATLTANVTANIHNVANIAGTVTSVTMIVDQGATPYSVANLQINGGGIQTIRWAGGTGVNPGTGSNTDIMSFSLINLGGGVYRVLGQISNYG